MPLCTVYNPRHAQASVLRTKGKGKGRRAKGVNATTTAFAVNAEIGATTPPVASHTTGQANATTNLAKAKEEPAFEGNSDEENVQPRSSSKPSAPHASAMTIKTSGLSNTAGTGPLSPLTNNSTATNTSEPAISATSASVQGDDAGSEANKDAAQRDDDTLSASNSYYGAAAQGQWRDKEGLAFEHARQRAKKASERARRRAKKAEMQAAAVAFVSPLVPVAVSTGTNVSAAKEHAARVVVREDHSKERDDKDGGHGLHKGARVGKVGTRKAESNLNIRDLVDVDMRVVDASKMGSVHERVRSMSGELWAAPAPAAFGGGDLFGGVVDDEGRREVSLSELVYFAAQKKPRKNKSGHDFEMIPAPRTVIVLDDVESRDMEMDEAWDHIDDLKMDALSSKDGEDDEIELSYAEVVAGASIH
ncbi:hypothetical protein CVT24_001148 [Panaeolus cyanescens]|uniref:Uncharacterized protein n=1 Tax=Panaeolus cyanescens TaxID=181874 RepID=A0A409WSA8_9AGAR|nr:hypothetical protein CVT24_001148 [Panaeolus cyanescens]